MALVELHRTRQRSHLPLPIRVERVEEDADVAEYAYDRLEAKVDRVTARLTGLLISIVLASLALVANLVVR